MYNYAVIQKLSKSLFSMSKELKETFHYKKKYKNTLSHAVFFHAITELIECLVTLYFDSPL